MHLKVLASQIPWVWEHVKYAVAQINEIPSARVREALTTLLYNLMSGKAQCWVSLNSDRIILNVSVTEFVANDLTGDTELRWLFFYAYQGVTNTTGQEIVRAYREFAKQNGCTRVVGVSRNPRAWELMEAHGFVPEYRTFVLEA